MVPENKNESCGTSAMRSRSVSNGSVDMSTVSMIIRPVFSGAMRNRAEIRDDLPAPVRPTMPIFSHGDTWNAMCRSDGCK